MPGIQHYVSVHPYPFSCPFSQPMSAQPFRSAVCVLRRERIRKNRTRSYLNGWRETQCWKPGIRLDVSTIDVMMKFMFNVAVISLMMSDSRLYALSTSLQCGRPIMSNNVSLQGGPKSKPPPIFQKIALKIANEIRFLRKVKVWVKHYNTIRW